MAARVEIDVRGQASVVTLQHEVPAEPALKE
jgi:hypothetical protein